MGRRIVLGVVGVLIGVIGGMVFMMGLHHASSLVYPIPEGLDMMSSDPAQQERLAAWIGTLPAGAFVLALTAHGLGCMGGAALATLIAGRRSLVPALVVGAVFTVAGVMNIQAMPHPAWFPFVDLPVYLALAYLAGRLLRRRESAAETEAEA